MSRVPVIILSGFLGSGKTTLLLNLLEESKQKEMSFGVIMNEFGKMDVDSHIINGRSSVPIQSLNDGCVCCSKKSELINSFEQLLKTNPTIIFIELTGIANPEEVMDEMLRKELISRIYVKSVVSLVDAETISNITTFDMRNTYARQLCAADSIIVNKIDLVENLDKSKIVTLIEQLNDSADLQFTFKSQVGLDQLLTINRTGKKQDKDSLQASEDIEQQADQPSYEYLSTIALPVPIKVTKNIIEEYFFCLKPNLIRAKGFVYLEEDNNIYLVQFIGNRLSWKVFMEYESQPFITLIGVDLHASQAFEMFSQLVKMPVEELLTING
ncbi:GTP-binding protein [Neobacillus niacini]|uniref:CobW family GTP-binding protein n=1 Tax=Neobacillus niacini TaxID=86668 RepID=UPI0007AC2709|nr:CobW family GTP-binding protein [Neobacillus niacini]MEC1521268.1 GTP-binding protein [Neobacillus niacini]